MQRTNSAEYRNKYSVTKNNKHLGILLDDDSAYSISQNITEYLWNGLLDSYVVVSTELKNNPIYGTILSRLKKISSLIVLEFSMVNHVFTIIKNRRNKLNKSNTSKASKKTTVTAFEFEKYFLLAFSDAWKNVLGRLTFQVFIDKSGKLNIVSEESCLKQ